MISRALKLSYWLCTLLFLGSSGQAAVYYSRSSGTFATKGNWSATEGGSANNTNLQSTDSFIILNGHNMTLGGAQIATAITIRSGGTLSLSANRTLTLTDPLTINLGGTLALTTYVLTMGASSVANSGAITGSTGGISRTTGTLTNTSTGIISMSGASVFTMGSGNFVNGNTAASSNFGSGAITVSGTSQSIGGLTTTGRLTASNSSGTITLTGDISCGGITKSGAGELNLGSGRVHTTSNTVVLTAGTINGNSSTLNVNFVGTNAWQGTPAVFVPANSTVNFSANGNQTLSASGTKTFYNLIFSGSGLKTNTSTTVNNLFTLQGTATASAVPTYGASSGLVYNPSADRTSGIEWPATFSGSQGVTISAMAITTNGNKTFNLDVPLTISSGATLKPAVGHVITLNGDLINNGTWTPSTGGVTIAGTRAAQSIGRFVTTGPVIMSKSGGTATFTGNINGGALTINGAGTLNLGAGLTHVFSGTWTLTSGILNGNSSILRIGGTSAGSGMGLIGGTSTVEFNGTISQIIPALNYHNLSITGNKGGGVITFASGTIGISGVFSPAATNLTYSLINNTVAFNGGVQTIPTFTFNNVVFSGGDKSIQSAVGVKNVEIQTGPTINITPPGILTIN